MIIAKSFLVSFALALMATQIAAFSASTVGGRRVATSFFMSADEEAAAVKDDVEEKEEPFYAAESDEAPTSNAAAPAEEEPMSPVMIADDGSALLELKALATQQNPLLVYFDPLQLATANFWSTPDKATIGFLRHAEIKHGRVAMAAFVGYWVQSNWHWPWKMSLDGSDFPSTDLPPEVQWDMISSSAKWQIIGFIGFLEFWDEIGGGLQNSITLETDYEPGLPHYMNGRMPGKFPSFKQFGETVHPIPELVDPLGLMKRMSEEKKARGRIAEVNNGRLAMIGIMGFLAADSVEGSVPLLSGIAQPYDGNVMIPFSNDFSLYATESVAEVASAATSVSEVVATVVDTVADKADFVPSLLN